MRLSNRNVRVSHNNGGISIVNKRLTKNELKDKLQSRPDRQ